MSNKRQLVSDRYIIIFMCNFQFIYLTVAAIQSLIDIANAQLKVFQNEAKEIEDVLRGLRIDHPFIHWQLKMLAYRVFHIIARANAKLPIFAFSSDIIESVKDNCVTIIQADTGSGKRWLYVYIYL